MKAHFAPKPPPPPKEKIPLKTSQHFVDLLERPSVHEEKRKQSDYDRSITKLYNEEPWNKCGKTVSQLGEQTMQSIPLLKVINTDDKQATDVARSAADIAREMGITIDQLLGKEEIAMADVAWKYVHGKSLVRPK